MEKKDNDNNTNTTTVTSIQESKESESEIKKENVVEDNQTQENKGNINTTTQEEQQQQQQEEQPSNTTTVQNEQTVQQVQNEQQAQPEQQQQQPEQPQPQNQTTTEQTQDTSTVNSTTISTSTTASTTIPSEPQPQPQQTQQQQQHPPRKTGKNFNLDDYITMLLIGSGNFSEIYMVEHKVTKILYAMKSFSKIRVEQLHKQEDVLMEKHVMEKIPSHPNIIGYYGSSKDDFSMYILYEYINGGDLWKRCVVYGLNNENRIKYYFIQLLHAIKHMHTYNVPHRDIKPENILVTKDEKLLKIIDFGSSYDLDGTEFSKKFDEEREKMKMKKPYYKHFVGTPNFMAPECVHNQFSDKRSDYWSLGCVLYNMFTGFPPFLGASEYLIFQKSIEGKYLFPKGIIPPLAEDLITKCIVVDANKRLNIDEMIQHPYLKDYVTSDAFVNKEVPSMTKYEEEYETFRKKMFSKYEKIKKHSTDLEAIQRHEEMEEDLKRNDITPERNENDKIMEELIKKKKDIQSEYDTALSEMNKELNESKYNIDDTEGNVDSSSDNDKQFKMWFNDKVDFLGIQLRHDIFNVIYRGYELPKKDTDSKDSDSD